MAFDYFQENDDENNNGAGPGRELGKESAVVTGSGGPEKGAPTSSGSFTNLNAYLDANRDEKFGERIAGQVDDKIKKADSEQERTGQMFRSAVDSTAVSKDDDTLSRLKSDPTSVDVNKFATMRDASYQGPNSFVDTPDLFTAANSATEKAYKTAAQTKDEGGRKAYLDETYGSGAGRYDYSRGQQKLDNLLIQNDPNTKGNFESFWKKAGETKNRFSDLSSALDAYASGRKAETAGARSAARATLGIDDNGEWLPTDEVRGNGVTQDELENLDALVSQKKSQLGADRTALESTYGKSNLSQLSPEALQRLGINPSQFSKGFNFTPDYVKNDPVYSQAWKPYTLDNGSTVGLDPRHYVTNIAADVDLNRSTLANQQTQARLAALAKLAGRDNNFIVPEQAGRMVDKPLYETRGGELATQAATRAGAMYNELDALRQRWAKVADGGQLDAATVRAEGNKIRAKYGLPPL